MSRLELSQVLTYSFVTHNHKIPLFARNLIREKNIIQLIEEYLINKSNLLNNTVATHKKQRSITQQSSKFIPFWSVARLLEQTVSRQRERGFIILCVTGGVQDQTELLV